MKHNRWCEMLLALLLALPTASSLGISPGINTIIFTPNENYHGSFTLHNRESIPQSVILVTQGELSPYITMPTETTLKPASEQPIEYTLTLPSSLPPGFHTVEIIAAQQQPIKQGQTVVNARVAVLSQVRVLVPYPEKYPEFELMITEHPTTIDFSLPTTNLGQQEIKKAYAIIRVVDDLNTFTTLTTQTVSIPPQQRRELTATWTPQITPGIYTAEVVLYYDGKERATQKQFSFQTQQALLINSIEVKEFLPGKVAMFEVELENTANTELDDVVAKLVIHDAQGNVLATITSPFTTIRPLGKEKVELKRDLSSIAEGSYTSVLTLFTTLGTMEQQLILQVTKEKVETSFTPPPTGYAITSTEKTIFTKKQLITAGGVILTTLLLFLGLRVLRRKRQTP